MNMEYQYDVFISYSRRDYVDENKNVIPGNAVSKIKECLKRANITYWFDTEDIKNSDAFAERIETNMEKSRMLLFISSKNSNASKWTRREISLANDNNKKILPLKIDDSKFGSGIGFILAGINYQEYFVNPELALETLVRDILDIKRDINEKELKSEIIATAMNANKAIQKQLQIINKVQKRLIEIGTREKKCPVCSSPIHLEQRYCECCGFYFPLMYGISEDVHIDETYLSIVKALWDSSPRTVMLPKPNIVSEIEPEKTKSSTEPVPKQVRSKNVFRVGNVEFRMNPVEGGSFMMGDKENAHKVSLSSYKIGETPVTQELWQVVMGDNPSKFKGEKRPVEQVSWDDCQKFIHKLNQLTGKDFRLPTEAEWEFAARGGNRSLKTLYSGGINLDDVAWYNLNCSENEDSGLNYGTHDVKAKAPNELRIYDMSGNVWEWCSDWFSDYSLSHEVNPLGPDSGSGKVCRGGSWSSNSECCSVSFRNYGGLLKRDRSYGLRLVL